MKRLNFGCGDKKLDGYDNVDIEPYSDFQFDFEQYPYPIPDNTYDYVLIDNVLEHMLFPLKVMNELHRICKSKATIHIRVPYYNSSGAYNDVTHYHYFNKRTFQNMEQQLKMKFYLSSVKLEPTVIGKFMPSFIRDKLSMVFGVLNGVVIAEFMVRK